MNPTLLLRNKNRLALLALAGALLLPCGGALRAAVIYTVQENNTLQTLANRNTVQDGNTSVNGLRGKESGSNPDTSGGRQIFLKFDLSSINLSTDKEATLSLTIIGINTGFTIQTYALNAGVTGYDWLGSTITWSNAPSNGGNLASHYINTAKATAVGSALTVSNALQTIDLQFTVTDWAAYLQTDSTITLILAVYNQSNSSGQIRFENSAFGDAATKPQLEVIPEPGTIALAVLGLGALTIFRRRNPSR